jgi:hypothetical protein
MPSKTCSALINEFTHAANQISKDEARRIAANIAYLLGLLPSVELFKLLQAATADSQKNFPNIQYG